MSEEQVSQDNTEETNLDAPEIGTPAEEEKEVTPAPIYEETEEDKKAAQDQDGDDATDTKEQEPESDGEEEEQKEEDTEEKEGDKADKDEPEEYDSLAKPEDSLLSDADMERILEDSKQEGLSKEAAQKRVEFADGLLKDYQEQQQQTLKATSEQWAKDTQADKELGGENYKRNVELARRAVHKFGSEKFRKDLNATGFGNHPELVRTFARIGKMMSDDSFVQDGSNMIPQKRTMEDVFYGENKTD